MISVYALKPRFQSLLRPLVDRLARAGITANAVTVAAMALSVAYGGALWVFAGASALYLALPLVLFVRMALNAIDGMLAREHGQKSTLGAYLNEIGDVASDVALILPLALAAPFSPLWVFAFALLAALSEFVGVIGPAVGASRRYDGPMGKSDRAAALGVLGVWIGLGAPLAAYAAPIMPALCLLLIWTIFNRVRGGVAEAAKSEPTP